MSNDYYDALGQAISKISLPDGVILMWEYDTDFCILKLLIEKYCCYKRVLIWPWKNRRASELRPIDEIIKEIEYELRKGIVIKIGI